ncbi:hypothetical protein [Glaciecola sp. 1036]|uniref:hypothetical protein n=1 Tax=Alteromonadaceae TaxID=72275 RepID=UPI003CFEE001
MKLLLLCLIPLALVACTNLPSPTQTAEADYGAYPEDYEAIAKAYLMEELRDPDSIVIESISEPQKQWIGDKVTGIDYGYLVCAKVNSKNLFGNMTGFRSDAVLIRNGEVVEYAKDGKLLSGMKLCD